MLRYGKKNFDENNQRRNSYSQDENAITPIRGRYKKYQKLKESQKEFSIENDSIPELNQYDATSYMVENIDSEDSDNIIRRKTNRVDNHNYKREAIKFDEEYLEKNLLLQEFLLNSKTIKNNSYPNDDDNEDDKLSNTIISSECIYQNFCNECGYDIPTDFEGNVCDLCQYTANIRKINVPDKICMKCGILFFGRDGAELCQNCQTIRNEQLLFEQNDLEKIYISEYVNNRELANKNKLYKNQIKNSNKNQKRFFHGIIDTLKRVKNNKKNQEKQNSSNPSLNRLQIVHNIDGYDNVFHTKDTFDINKISVLKANSSHAAKDLDNLKNNNDTNDHIKSNQIKSNDENIEKSSKLKIKKSDSKSDSSLHRIKKIKSSSPLISDSFNSYDYNKKSKVDTTIDASIQSIQSDEKFLTKLKKFSHSTPLKSNKSVNRNNSNNSSLIQKQLITEKVNSVKNNYQNNHSGALKKQYKYNDTNNCKPDFSMDSTDSLKSNTDYSGNYCVLFDSVIEWLRILRNDQHIYYNFDYDDSIFCIKNIPSRTNYDNFGYSYLTATTSTTFTTTTTSSNKSYKSCYSYNNNNNNNNRLGCNNSGFPNNFTTDYCNYPIYTEMQKNNKINHKISKLHKNCSNEDQNLIKNNKETISGNSIFYTVAANSSNETFNLPQEKNNNNTERHSIHELQVNDLNLKISPPQYTIPLNLSLAYSSIQLSPTTDSLCLPYEFSNNNNTSGDIESVRLYSSTEQQVISVTGGIIDDNNKQIVKKNNSRQEIQKQKNQQKQQFKYQENNILYKKQQQKSQILNESKNSQLKVIEGDSKNITQTTTPLNNSFITCCSSSSDSNCSDCSSCISELNDEYTQNMVDNFKRNLMEKQKYNEFIKQQQRSKRRAIYLKPGDETVHQLQLNYHNDNIKYTDDNNILLQQQQHQQSNFNCNSNSDLENNSNSEINKLNEQNDTDELKNAILNTIASNRFGICEISNINDINKNNNNITSNGISNEFVNDLMNTFESALKRRVLKTKESELYNKNCNNNNNSEINDIDVDINCNENNKKLPEIEIHNKNLNIENNYELINCELSSNFNYQNKFISNYHEKVIKSDDSINLSLNVIISKLFPSQIIKLENIIIALNLSKSLNKIIIFYDKNLSLFLNYIQNTQKYSRCEQNYLFKFFRNFQRFVITKQISERENLKKIQNKCNQIEEEKHNEIFNNNNNNILYDNVNLKEVVKENSIINIKTDPNKNFPNNSCNNIEINNKIIRKKPVPPPRRFLPHMAPTLPPTPPLKPRNLIKTVELEQLSSLTPANSIKISPIVPPRGNSSNTNKNLSLSSSSTKISSHSMRSQLKDDDDIYQPIWKCQTSNNTTEKNNDNNNNNNNNSKSDLELKYVGNNKASFNNNNESVINNKANVLYNIDKVPSSSTLSSSSSLSKTSSAAAEISKFIDLNTAIPTSFIEDNNIKDDSSTTEDTSEQININTTEEDHSEWETDDEFMFSTKMNIISNSINDNSHRRKSNTNLNNIIRTNKENEDDYYNSGSSTSTGSTLTGSNCIRISKSDPELKRESILINKKLIDDQKNIINNNSKNDNNNNNNNNNSNNNNLWKTVCIIYSPTVTKYRKILYDYNSNEMNFNINGKFYDINNKNIELNTVMTATNLNSTKNNNEPQLEVRARKPNLINSENQNISVIFRSDSFRLNTKLHENYENIVLKRKMTAMAAIASASAAASNSTDMNCNSGSSESVTNDFNKSDFLCSQNNFNNNYKSIILAWKETLMDINFIEDEEDMFVSEEEILKLKETVVQPEPNRLQRYKSQSTDNLHSIPDAQDKKSIGERFRNKLQRGVLKLNSRQVKDSAGGKKGKETFKRLNVNSVCFEEGIQPKYPVFCAELQEVEMNSLDENVPRFVVDCIEIIEQKDCIQIDGLYRASGNKVAIDDLKKRITENYIFDYKLLIKNEDIHTITGLLKSFFRELKTPLIPETFYRKLPDNLVDSSSLPLIKEILNGIPQPAIGTLKYLLKHLTTVAQYSSENRMPASNLAIVWGPCILLSNNTGPFDIGRMNTLAKILIEKYDFIFGDDERLVN